MTDKTIAIQIGAVSFQDEGVGEVLDTAQQRNARPQFRIGDRCAELHRQRHDTGPAIGGVIGLEVDRVGIADFADASSITMLISIVALISSGRMPRISPACTRRLASAVIASCALLTRATRAAICCSSGA